MHLFVEGDLHPADMAWCACLTKEQYKNLCLEYRQYANAFDENITTWKDYIILAYTKIEHMEQELFHRLESHEVYDGQVGRELFCELHKSRWEKFGQEASGITIFECALLQNHINELLLFHGASEKEILHYIKALVDTVTELKPIMIYLDVDTKASIQRAAEERVDENGNRVWENFVTEYISNTPYGKKQQLSGVDGMNCYFDHRKRLELKLLEQFPIGNYVIPINTGNQDERADQLIEMLLRQIGLV